MQTIAAGTNEELEQAEIADEAGPAPTETKYLPDTARKSNIGLLSLVLCRMIFRQLKMPL